jgi:dipeptidyl aminopeptidase/acylaminoacyl peptidase
MAVLAAVLLAGVVVQRMATPPSARVVRSVQLTFTGQVTWPDIEAAFFPGLATDGGRVYYTQMTGNRFTVAQSSVGGGEFVTIRTPFNHALLLHVSPDGSRLLVRDFDWAQQEGPLWVIPAVGGAPLRLGAVVAHDGAWSPDGKRVVFARGDELYVAVSDGSEPRKLATTPGQAFWVRWSPDGTRLRFTVVSPQGYTRSLWEVSAEGHGLRPVPLGRREYDLDCCGEWSPDGRQFFFRRFRDNRADIWAIRERTGLFGGMTTGPARVTSGPLLFPAGVPTRDGRRLLASAANRGARTCGSIRARANSHRTTWESGDGGSHSRETERGWPTSSPRRASCGAADSTAPSGSSLRDRRCRSCCRGGRPMARGSPSWDGRLDGPGRSTSLRRREANRS